MPVLPHSALAPFRVRMTSLTPVRAGEAQPGGVAAADWIGAPARNPYTSSRFRRGERFPLPPRGAAGPMIFRGEIAR